MLSSHAIPVWQSRNWCKTGAAMRAETARLGSPRRSHTCMGGFVRVGTELRLHAGCQQVLNMQSVIPSRVDHQQLDLLHVGQVGPELPHLLSDMALLESMARRPMRPCAVGVLPL